MSYAGPAARGGKASGMGGSIAGRQGSGRAAGASNRTAIRATKAVETEPDKLTVFAGGLALGLLIGGGVALMFAPAPGKDTRRALARRGKRIHDRSSDAWSDLRFEFERMKRRRRNARRRRRAEHESQ